MDCKFIRINMIVERFDIPFYMEEKQKILFKLFLAKNESECNLTNNTDFSRASDLLELFMDRKKIEQTKMKKLLKFYLDLFNINKVTIDLKSDLRDLFEEQYDLLADNFNLSLSKFDMTELHDIVLNHLTVSKINKYTDNLVLKNLTTTYNKDDIISVSQGVLDVRESFIRNNIAQSKDNVMVVKQKLDIFVSLYISVVNSDLIKTLENIRSLQLKGLYVKMLEYFTFNCIISNEFDFESISHDKNFLDILIKKIIRAVKVSYNSPFIESICGRIEETIYESNFHNSDLFNQLVKKLGRSEKVINLIHFNKPFNNINMFDEIMARMDTLFRREHVDDPELVRISFNVMNIIFKRHKVAYHLLKRDIRGSVDNSILKEISKLEEDILFLENALNPRDISVENIDRFITIIKDTYSKHDFSMFFDSEEKIFLFLNYCILIATLLFKILPNHLYIKYSKNEANFHLETVDLLKIILTFYWKFVKLFQDKIAEYRENNRSVEFKHLVSFRFTEPSIINFITGFEYDFASKKILSFEDNIYPFKSYLNPQESDFAISIAKKVDKSNFISITYDMFKRLDNKINYSYTDSKTELSLLIESYINAIEYICDVQRIVRIQSLVDFFKYDLSVLNKFVKSLKMKNEDTQNLINLVNMYQKFNEIKQLNFQRFSVYKNDTNMNDIKANDSNKEEWIGTEFLVTRLYNIYEIQNEMKKFGLYFTYEEILTIILSSPKQFTENKAYDSITVQHFISTLQQSIYNKAKMKLKIKNAYFITYYLVFIFIYSVMYLIGIKMLKDVIINNPTSYLILLSIVQISFVYISIQLFLPLQHSYMQKVVDEYLNYNQTSGKHY